jgi:hypothetical protein
MSRSLTARLRGHVPGQVDVAGLAWWMPPRSARPLAGGSTWWRRGARWRRDAQLAEIVGHLAMLVALGSSLPLAVRQVVAQGRGALVDDLSVVAGWMRDGLPAPVALRRWAGVAGCDGVSRLAAVAGAPGDDMVARLDDLAAALHQRAHDHRMAVLGAVAHGVWFMTLLAAVVAVVNAG